MTIERRCVVVGAGGHARVLIDALHDMPGVEVRGLIAADEGSWGTSISGIAVLGGDILLAEMTRLGVDSFVIGVGGIGDNRPRQRLFDLAVSHGLRPLTVRHTAAIVSRAARIGDGSQLLPGCMVNAGAEVGRNVIVNTGAILEHDCRVGDHAHVATGAVLAGMVTVGQRTHIGAGATIRQAISIGDDVVVGAGAVVVKDVPSGVTVIGVPARPVRQRVGGKD